MNAQRMTVISLLAIALTATGAGAADAPKGRPCQPDIQKLCKDVKLGAGRIRDCLKEHAAQLSPGCKQMMDTNQGIFGEAKPGSPRHRAQGVLEACKDDLDKHCKGIEPGGGRLQVCLDQHKSELSDSCKKAVAALPPQAKTAAGGTPAAKAPAKK
jgi:hypothetical protein